MYKLIFGAKRKPGMSREDFGRYRTTVHAEKAKKVPGISRYALDIPWHPALGENVAGTLATSLLITVIGVAASADVLRRKPLATLRAE